MLKALALRALLPRSPRPPVSYILIVASSCTAPPEAFLSVKEPIAAAEIAVASDELAFLPENEIEVSRDDAEKSLALLSALDDHDDVQNVSVNFQIPDEIAAKE